MKRFLAMFLAVALLSTLLFGCSSGSSQSSSAGGNTESGEASGTSAEEASSSGNGEPVTIQVAVSGSAQELDIHQQKFDLYTEEHPNVLFVGLPGRADGFGFLHRGGRGL